MKTYYIFNVYTVHTKTAVVINKKRNIMNDGLIAERGTETDKSDTRDEYKLSILVGVGIAEKNE